MERNAVPCCVDSHSGDKGTNPQVRPMEGTAGLAKAVRPCRRRGAFAVAVSGNPRQHLVSPTSDSVTQNDTSLLEKCLGLNITVKEAAMIS